jgi:hypothetical protein
MAFELEFLELMPHVVTVISYLGEDFRGDPIYDDANPKRYISRIVGKGLALRTRLSDQTTVIYDIYVGPRLDEDDMIVPDSSGDVFRVEDKIVLPPDEVYTDQTPVIFAIGRFPDDGGHHHTKIQCGWMYHRQGQ